MSSDAPGRRWLPAARRVRGSATMYRAKWQGGVQTPVAARREHPVTTLPEGPLLGAYRLDAPLGRGGQGSVWAARHADTGRQVAPCKPAEELKDEMSALKHRDHVQPADSASGAVTVEGKPRSSSTEDEELTKKEMEVLDQTPQSQTQRCDPILSAFHVVTFDNNACICCFHHSYESVVKSRLLRSVRTLSGGANKSLIQDEESAVGSVSFQVCCRCLGLRAPQAVISFILMVATTTTVVLHGWWLAEWTEDEDQDGRVRDTMLLRSC